LWSVTYTNNEINIKQKVIEKILEEERKYPTGLEFGGWLSMDGKTVDDIYFGVERSTFGFVELEATKIPDNKRHTIKGWFHKHPITGLSQLDKDTIESLTNFWGECYSLVLQSNRKILCVKTVSGTKLNPIIQRNPFSLIVKSKKTTIQTLYEELPCQMSTKIKLA